MLKIILPILIVATISYILLCIFMFFKQGNLLFFPAQAEDIHYKELHHNTALQNIKLQTKDGNTLDGWRQINPNEQYTLLYFGGNAEETSYFVEGHRYKNANIISFNYRSYGLSTGKVSEKTLFSDALEEYDFLIQELKIHPENIIIIGRSLGTGIATYLSSQRGVKGVILITPYDSIESLAKEGYPFIPVSLLLTNKFDSLTYGKLRSNHLLCIYGGKDTVIPNHHTKNLLKHWNGPIEDIFLPEADHENIFYRTESRDGIERFISQL